MNELFLVLPLLFSAGLSVPAFVPVTKCSEYDCTERLDYKNYQDTWILRECVMSEFPSAEGWFSKPKGWVEEGSLIGICKANGYDSLDSLVWQADTRFPDKHESEEEWKCNKVQHKNAYPDRGWTDLAEKAAIDQGVQSLPHATFKCVNFPKPKDPVTCCQVANFQKTCLAGRIFFNNFVMCNTWSVCKDACTDAFQIESKTISCHECCTRDTVEWNCFSKSPTSSPISPSKSPTTSPTPKPVTASPTRAPITPSKSPTKTPTPAPVPVESVKSCAELGWSDEIKNLGPPTAFDGSIAVPGVCGTKSGGGLPGAQCTKMITFENAEMICLAMGARMCTLEEYEALEAGNSGCAYEGKKNAVWTGTKCSSDLYYSIVIADKGHSTLRRCNSKAYGGRCCADVRTNGPTVSPTRRPITSNAPTGSPSNTPTKAPITSNAPTRVPTKSPSDAPTRAPTKSPITSDTPTRSPTKSPITSDAPTRSPTKSPITSDAPTRAPTKSPITSDSPTRAPTKSPITSDAPSRSPTKSPITTTNAPTRSPLTTDAPITTTDAPTRSPTKSPITITNAPSRSPTKSPISTTNAPTRSPTKSPSTTNSPTRSPTSAPVSETESPTAEPAMTKAYASILCKAAGADKKACKQALPKEAGKCKATKGKKGGCKLKDFYPVCEDLKKRECKKAVAKKRCEAADSKMKSCKTPVKN